MFSVPAVRREVVSTAEEPVPDMYTLTGLAGIGKTGSLSSVMVLNRIEACFHAVVATCRDSFSTVSLNSAVSFVLPAEKYTNSRPAVGASNYPGLISSAVFFVDFPDRLCLPLPISVVQDRLFSLFNFFNVVRSCPVWSGLVWSGLVCFGLIQSGPVRSCLFGLVRFGPVQSSLVRSGPVRSGPIRSGLVRYGSVRSSPVWSGLVLVRFDPVQSGPVLSPCDL